jgi:hypothetical protein
MARRITIKLKVHKGSGRLYKTIGRALGRDGQPKKKVWYFDASDEGEAVSRVVELKARWRALRAPGHVVWDEDPLYGAERVCGTRASASRLITKPATVGDAATIYLTQLQRRAEAKQITQAHFASQKARLQTAIAPIASLPLTVIGEQRLAEHGRPRPFETAGHRRHHHLRWLVRIAAPR